MNDTKAQQEIVIPEELKVKRDQLYQRTGEDGERSRIARTCRTVL